MVFVGTRQPGRMPFNAMSLFRDAATVLASRNVVIRSGGEVGSDRMAAEAALAAGGQVELFLPNAAFGDEWIRWIVARYPDQVTVRVFDPHKDEEWAACVREIHPSGRFLSRASTANLARSCGMVIGAMAVVALPFVRQNDRGVPGLVLDLAQARGVPTYDLSMSEGCRALRSFLDGEATPPS